MEADLAAGAVADVNAHAAVPAISDSKNQKLQKSDNLLWLLADIIHANLCTMHMVFLLRTSAAKEMQLKTSSSFFLLTNTTCFEENQPRLRL